MELVILELERYVLASEQAFRTNTKRAKIDKTQAESKCRSCGKVDDTVRSIVYERYIGKYVEKLVLM